MKESIISNTQNLTLLDSLFVTLVCLSIVFLILVIISFLLSLFKYIPQETTKSFKEIKNQKVIIKDENMRIAIMVATIDMAKDRKNSNIRVKRVTALN